MARGKALYWPYSPDDGHNDKKAVRKVPEPTMDVDKRGAIKSQIS